MKTHPQIGHPDASRELESGDLRLFFVDSAIHSRVSTTNPVILIGRKGAGKTALFELLRRSGSEKPLMLDLASLPLIYDAVLRGVASSPAGDRTQRYAAFWRLFILTEFMTAALKSSKIPWLSRDRMAIYRHLVAIGRIDASLLKKTLLTLGTASNLFLKFDAASLIETLAAGTSVGVFDQAVDSTERLCRQHSLTVSLFMDNLDAGWRERSDQISFTEGLLDAAFSLDRFTTRSVTADPTASAPLTLQACVPLDTWVRFAYRHYDRHFDHFVTVTWTKRELRNFLDRRVGIKVFGLPEDGVEGSSQRLLPPIMSIDGNSLNSLDFVLGHTLYRPRDILFFLALLLKDYDPFRDGPINQTQLLRATGDFSRYLRSFVVGEFNDAFPLIDEILTRLEGVAAIGTLEELLQPAVSSLGDNTRLEVEGAFDMLYTAGVIGVIPAVHSAAVDDCLFVFRGARPRPLRQTRLIIHPAFWSVLDVQDPPFSWLSQVAAESDPGEREETLGLRGGPVNLTDVPLSALYLNAEKLVDEQLRKHFVRTQAITRALDVGATLVTGQRGAGRTTFGRWLSSPRGLFVPLERYFPWMFHPGDDRQPGRWAMEVQFAIARRLVKDKTISSLERRVARLASEDGPELKLKALTEELGVTVSRAFQEWLHQAKVEGSGPISIVLGAENVPPPGLDEILDLARRLEDRARSDGVQVRVVVLASSSGIDKEGRDIDKLVGQAVHLEWKYDELEAVVSMRLGNAHPHWQGLFPPSIVNEFGVPEPGWPYLLRRVAPLPRDIIRAVTPLVADVTASGAAIVDERSLREALHRIAAMELKSLEVGMRDTASEFRKVVRALAAGNGVADARQLTAEIGDAECSQAVRWLNMLFDIGLIGVVSRHATGEAEFCYERPFRHVTMGDRVVLHLRFWQLLSVRPSYSS